MINRRNVLYYICGIGLIIRLGFLLAGAKFYFGRPNIYVDGDTSAWAMCIENLIKHGTYTLNPDSEYGYFGRMPGYSFFMGFFYLLCGKNWNIAYPVIGWFQSLLDIFTIAIIFSIAKRIFNSTRAASITALVYATYPFVFVWTPVVYSEYMSFFFMFSALYYVVHPEKRFNYGWAGLLLAAGALCRPQLLLLFPIIGLFILYRFRKNIAMALRNGAVYGCMFLVLFGLWPARNYIHYHKFILTQDLRGIKNWDQDVIAYMLYIYSVKAEWEPQFTEILKNQKVEIPPKAFYSSEDSIRLEKAIALSKTCGSGFSAWHDYWKDHISGANCNAEIKSLFDTLRMHAIQHNPFRFYVTLPLLNLEKAIFKVTLTDTKTMARKVASLLFLYRTLLILLGIVGCWLMIRRKQSAYFAGILLAFFVSVYITLCSGTGPQFRNIEIRYFIHPDLLLLFPASYVIFILYDKYIAKKKEQVTEN